MFNWLWNRIFSDKNVGLLIKKSEPYMSTYFADRAKEAAFKLLGDEEFQAWVTQMTDAYYDRYMQKINGWLGGKQKGINYAIRDIASQNNPLDQVLDEDGNFNLAKAARTFLSGAFRSQSTPRNITPGRRELPIMGS